MTIPYDSAFDTLMHIQAVQTELHRACFELMGRAGDHDRSKLQEPEKAVLDKYTPLLKDTAYTGPPRIEDPEFQEYLKHHYAWNSHHPEHHEAGIGGMSLLDLIEMLCDWRAASQRHPSGSIDQSLEINRKRFQIDPVLYGILVNTAKELGWMP